MSSPASSGSSPPAQASSARPPPNSRANSSPKCSFSASKAAVSRLRPSWSSVAMPRRSCAIAAVRSSRSRSSPPSRASISAASCAASRLTGPIALRSRTSRSSRAARSAAACPAGRLPGLAVRPTSALSWSGAMPRRSAISRAQPAKRVLGGLAARLQPGPAFARGGDRRLGPARRLGGLPQPRFGGRQRVLGRLSLGGCRGGAARPAPRALLRSPPGGRPVPRFRPPPRSCRSVRVRLLCRGIVVPLAPRLRLAGHRRQPARAALGRAHHAIERGARLGVAAARGRRPRIVPCRAPRGRAAGSGSSASPPSASPICVASSPRSAADLVDRLDDRGELRLADQKAPRQLGLGLARPRQPLFGGAQLPGGGALGGGGRLALGPAARGLRRRPAAPAASRRGDFARPAGRAGCAGAAARPRRSSAGRRRSRQSRPSATSRRRGPPGTAPARAAAAGASHRPRSRPIRHARGAAPAPAAPSTASPSGCAPSGSGAGSSGGSATQPGVRQVCRRRLPASEHQRRGQFAVEQCRDRRLEPRRDPQLRQQRRPFRARRIARRQNPAQRLRLRFERRQHAVGVARPFERGGFAAAEMRPEPRRRSPRRRGRSPTSAAACVTAARRGGSRFGRHDRGEQRVALLFAVGEPRVEPRPALRQIAALPVERSAARLAAGGGFGRLLQPSFGRGEITGRRLGPRRRGPAFVLGLRAGALEGAALLGELRSARPRRRRGARPRARDRRRSAPGGVPPRRARNDPGEFLIERLAGMRRGAAIRRRRRRLARTQRRQCRLGLGARLLACRARRRSPPPDRVPRRAIRPQDASASPAACRHLTCSSRASASRICSPSRRYRVACRACFFERSRSAPPGSRSHRRAAPDCPRRRAISARPRGVAHRARPCRPPRRAARAALSALPRSARRSAPVRPARRNAVRMPRRRTAAARRGRALRGR